MKLNYLPLWATGLFLSFSPLTSCKEDLENAVPASAEVKMPAGTTQPNLEEAYAGVSGIAKEGVLDGQPIRYLEKNGQALWQGDFILSIILSEFLYRNGKTGRLLKKKSTMPIHK